MLVPALWPKLRAGPGSTHLSVCMVLSKSHAGGRLAHACGSNPLTFPTHGLGRVGIYRLSPTGWEPPQVCAVPHHMWRASGGKEGPAGPSPAAGGSCPSFPSRRAAAPTRCTPEGTPALRLLLRCAACRSCTTLVGMSPPMLRACGAACRLRFQLAISMRCVLARDALACLSCLPPALAGVLPKVLLRCASSCAVPPAAPAPRWSVCPLPCCVRAVPPAACAAQLAISMRCVLARDALACLSCLPPALAGVLPKVLLRCASSCAMPPAAPAPRWSVCPLPCCVRAVLPAALLAISMRCVLARDARAHLSRLPPALAGVLPKVLLHCVPYCAAPPAAPALRWSVCPLPCCVRAVLPAACASLLVISMRCVLARAALAYHSCPPPALVAPSAATLYSASPSSASSASSGSSNPLPDAASNASLPR